MGITCRCLTAQLLEHYFTYCSKTKFKSERLRDDTGTKYSFPDREEVIVYYDSKKVLVQGTGRLAEFEELIKKLDTFFEKPPKVFINFAYAFDGGNNKDKVKAMVEELGFEPIILEEQVNHGQLVLEKLIGAIREAEYGVVLLSPDDELKTGEFKPRANVMIELGMLLMRFSPSPTTDGGKKNLAVINYGLKQEEIAKYLSDFSGFCQILYDLKPDDKDSEGKKTVASTIQEAKDEEDKRILEADTKLKADLAKELAVLYPAMTL